MLGVFTPPKPPHTLYRGLRLQALDPFGLNPPSQLVMGYRWLGFLNQVRKNYLKSKFTTNFEYKIDRISKIENRKIVRISAKSVSEHCVSNETKNYYFSHYSKNFERPYLKN